MELCKIDEKSDLINSEQSFSIKDNDKYTMSDIGNSIIYIKIKKSQFKFKDIPFIIYPALISLLIFIIGILIYLIFLSKYEIKYIYEEDAYEKPKYSEHKYSSITFENGLKIVLVQVNQDDKAGAVISFDYGYLDNRFEPGYLELAFNSLINKEVSSSENLTNYFGSFSWEVDKYYSSFYFQILGGGFQSYLKIFSQLTYLKDNDERFNNIGNNYLNEDYKYSERKNHLLEYLIYGYKNSQGEDIIPMNYDDIIEDLKGDYTQIKNIMRIILSDPTKIKVVIYSHYKMSLMKKYFLNYFKDIINKSKNNNNINQNNAYNTGEFNPEKIIYYKIYQDENNYLEINYFLNNGNIAYNQLIKDSQYLLYITYILNQTNEGSLYYELNNAYKDISIRTLSCNYEVILKSKIKFSIKVELNLYSYNYITDIISKVYNYMNNIMLYINTYDENTNDIRVEELQIICEQIFTFTEDAHESIFFVNLATDLFYKDEKNYLLKQVWFTKQNFINNINTVKYYFNQFTVNNSVIVLGINEIAEVKYKLKISNISFVFKNINRTKFYYLIYSLNEIKEHFNVSYDNNYSMLLNPKKNEFISKYDFYSDLEYNSEDYDNYFKITHEEISNASDSSVKLFWIKDTSFHIPKIHLSIYFFHPFYRPNFKENNEQNSLKKNDILYFEYLIYLSYIGRAIEEQLSDFFRAGGKNFELKYNENFFSFYLTIFSDKAEKALNIINNILHNQTSFNSELTKKFEIYRDLALFDFFYSDLYTDSAQFSDIYKIERTFYEALTKDKNNNLPPIYNIGNFPVKDFLDIDLKQLDIDEILKCTYLIKYIYIFGYYNKTDALEVYKSFKLSDSFKDFNLPFILANYSNTKINVTNFVDWTLEKPLIENTINVTSNINENFTTRYMNFVGYTLKTACLTDMLMNILTSNENFHKYSISINAIKQTFIYIRFTFEGEVIENNQFLRNIIVWLKENKDMRKKVDVIGDRFYYFLKGFKKISSVDHYTLSESGWNKALDNIYKTVKDNNILEFNMNSYDIFIQEIEKYIVPGIPFIGIVPKK